MTSRAIKAVIFDVGGVIVRDEKMKASMGGAFPGFSETEIWTAMNEWMLPACRGEKTLAESWKAVAETLGTDISEDLANTLWISDYSDLIEIDKKLLQFIKKLRTTVKTAIVSNTISEHADILRPLGVYEPFDVVTLSFEHGLTKDSAQIFKSTLRRLQVSAGEAVFVDDVERFAAVAESAGMKTILYKNFAQFKGELQKLGVG